MILLEWYNCSSLVFAWIFDLEQMQNGRAYISFLSKSWMNWDEREYCATRWFPKSSYALWFLLKICYWMQVRAWQFLAWVLLLARNSLNLLSYQTKDHKRHLQDVTIHVLNQVILSLTHVTYMYSCIQPFFLMMNVRCD